MGIMYSMSLKWPDFVKIAGDASGIQFGAARAAAHQRAAEYRRKPQYTKDGGMTVNQIEEKVRARGLEPIQPDDDVAYFYNAMTPGLASATPGAGSGSSRIVPNFWKDNIMMFGRSPSIGAVAGQYVSRNGYRRPNERDVLFASGRPHVLVHEMKHGQHDDSVLHIKPLSKPNIAISPQDRRLLAKAYPFRIPGSPLDDQGMKDMLAAERRAVNAEHQFRVMMDMKKALGRYPTAQEYIKHVRGLSNDALMKYLLEPMSYDKRDIYPNQRSESDRGEPRAIEDDQVDAYRKALIEVVKNKNAPAMGGWSGFVPRSAVV